MSQGGGVVSGGAEPEPRRGRTVFGAERHGHTGGVARVQRDSGGPRTAAARLRRYYDANTRLFLLAGSQQAIHRELWGPGVGSRAEAADHAHALVLDELDQLGSDARRAIDLGCGVGAAARYLARRREVEVLGVTISPAQAGLAQRFTHRAGPLRGTVCFRVADFTALPRETGFEPAGFDLAFAVESFVHADPAAAFLAEAARLLRPGGVLVVIDDVRTGAPSDPRLDDFVTGWQVASLLSVPELHELAAAAGLRLVASRDLSALQRLGRPRDRLVHLAQPLLRRIRGRSAWAASMVGGHALQACHRAGLLEYRLLRFVRTPRP